MSSILTGYEYDIFISYRQKDNKYDGWVTEFVDNLKKELEATVKDDVTIYFDINQHDGLLLILNKQYEDARRNLQKIIVTNPDYAAAYNRIGYSYYIEGNFAEAIKNYNKAFDLSGQLSSKIEIVIALAHSGKIDEAKKLFDQILIENKLLNQRDFVIGAGIGVGYAASMAMVYFSFGEPDEAFVWLNKAYDEREALMIGLKIDPIYDPYRKDPRFISIYKKMNFPE
jgi:tetratricopeptide (TPR) repeat protein